MKFIGYVLIALANVILADSGIVIDTWQYWVITLSFIVGQCLICWSKEN